MEHAHEQWLALLTLATFLLAIAVYGWRSSPYAAVNRNFAIQTLVVTCWVIGIAGTHSRDWGLRFTAPGFWFRMFVIS